MVAQSWVDWNVFQEVLHDLVRSDFGKLSCVCVTVNNVVVHDITGEKRKLVFVGGDSAANVQQTVV